MFKIGNRIVGKDNEVFVIAEAGVNHNGDINLAKKMIDMAIWAGADAIKFQTFKTEKLVTGYAAMAKYQKDNIGLEDSQFNMLKKLELYYKEFRELKDYCDNKNILFLSTPFDFQSVDFLNSIGMEAFKISSGDLNNIPFLEYISKLNKPIILSSGMATIGEVEEALNVIYASKLRDVAVLHCTTSYPAKLESVNLKAMVTIRDAFKVVCGYSDHTEGIVIPIAATSLGANIIEKHFTLDKTMKGPDHKASLEPKELKEMIENIRNIQKAMGSGIKMFTESEEETRNVARKSIVASRNIKAGELIEMNDIEFKRPGTGIMPKYYKDIIGKKARVDIEMDAQINFGMIE